MPPLVLSTSDSEYTNDASLSDAPAVWLTGDRIRFINSESGRVIAASVGVAAIRMDGADGVVINQAGGVIRTATMDGTQLVIQGSAGSDRVENEGTIVGLVALGEGIDTFISRRAASDYQMMVDLGGGDDVYYLLSNAAYSSTGNVDGGAGIDRCVVSETSGFVGGSGTKNFEILEIRGNGFMESFTGFETIVLDFRGEGRNFNGLRFFNTPGAQVEILAAGNNANVSIYDRSAIAGVTGSAFNDSLDLGNDTLVSGTIDLGGGNDYMIVRRSQFENPQQSIFGEKIDGGEGTDFLSIQLQGGDTFDAGNVVNFERMEVSASAASSLALIIRNVDHLPELTIRPFYLAPVRLEASDLSAGSVKVEPTGSLIIAADSVVGLVYSQTPFPIDTAVADDTKSLSIVNEGQIIGEVRLYIGDDLFDSRIGTVGGHVFGYAGNDRLLADIGNNWLDGGAGADYLSGGAGNDVLIGGSASDTLIGGTGDDDMRGGTGNDNYFVDASGDQVTEATGEGSDTVFASVSYQLGAGQSVEVLAAQDNSQTVILNLTGNELANTILGNNGNNFLDGGAGADIMTGFGGDDIYAIDNAGDLVDEANGGGNDSIFTTFSYVLGLGASVETLAARDNSLTVAMNLFGNELNNVIFGNNGTNFIDGSTGADIMTGFGGDDTYAVDNAGDVVIEDAGRGNDAIFTTFSYVLGLGMSVETLASRDNSLTVAMNLFGNELDNFIFGNNGANLIDGGAGADTMTGFGGNDSYIVDNFSDRVAENPGGGNDAIYTTFSYVLAATHSIETLAARDNSLTTALNLTGNELGNTLLGNNGANVLNGGAGADVLVGFGGADSFAFTAAAAAGNADTIADFLAGTDKIALDDAFFAGIGTPGSFNAAAFATGSAAAAADDRIIYNSATGQLLYDADGTGAGAAVLLATLQGNPVLSASDFQVI